MQQDSLLALRASNRAVARRPALSWYFAAFFAIGLMMRVWRMYINGMKGEDFYIAFRGNKDRFEILSRFIDRLKSVKATLLNEESPDEAIRRSVLDNTWIDLLDSAAIERLSANGAWQLEDILECVLNGEYELVSVCLDGQAGRLIYDPWSFPFGGTDPIKALIEAFGMEITRDSFHDGFNEWQKRNG
jgi:hypothetical protein